MFGLHPNEFLPSEEIEAGLPILESRAQGLLNRGDVRSVACDRRDRDTDVTVQLLDVDHVEPAECSAVEEDEGEPLPVPGPSDRVRKDGRRVVPIDMNACRDYRLHIVRRADDDADDGNELFPEPEGRVIDSKDAGLWFHRTGNCWRTYIDFHGRVTRVSAFPSRGPRVTRARGPRRGTSSFPAAAPSGPHPR